MCSTRLSGRRCDRGDQRAVDGAVPTVGAAPADSSPQLRHGSASNVLDAGGAVDEAQHLLGHAQASSTQVYLNPRELHQTGEKSQVASSGRRTDELQRYYELTV
ncbi:tyrosine-type recombinase/integrase [Streptomyces sp. NPDC003032]